MPILGEDTCLVCREPLFLFQDTYCSRECEQFDWDIKDQYQTEYEFEYPWGVSDNGSTSALQAERRGSNPLPSTIL